MNKIFKVIYSKTRHCYVVVSELAKSHCKTAGSHTARNKTALTAAVLMALGTFSAASVFMPMTAEAADTTKTDGSNFVGVERTDGLLDDNKYDNYGGKGAQGADSITLGLKAQAGSGTITIGDRNAGASLGSVYVGQGDVANPKADNGGWATSIGYNSDATGYGSIALGSNAVAKNSYAKDSKGESLELNQTYVDNGVTKVRLNSKPDIQRASVAIGYGASADNGNIAIGSYSDASTDLRTAKTTDGKEIKSYLTDTKADSYVSVGKSDALRRISNVADGAASSDVATVGQLQALSNKVGVYNAGFGIKIDSDTAKKTNTISLNRNLGTNLDKTGNLDLTVSDTGLVLDTVVPEDLWQKEKEQGLNFQHFGATGDYAVTVGGVGSMATGKYSTVSGGYLNTAEGEESAVFGGSLNKASNYKDSVFGGTNNVANGSSSSILGGSNNMTSASDSVIVGGNQNATEGLGVKSTVLGGSSNATSGYYSVVAGGEKNKATGENSSVFGGCDNKANAIDSVASGGQNNAANGNYSAAFGGSNNTVSGQQASVFGGYGNSASGQESAVVGGTGNTATNAWASVFGGASNTATGVYSAVTGGSKNIVNGSSDFAAGGTNNRVLGDEAASFGGKDSVVQGTNATGVAGGSTGAKANNALAAGYQSVVTTENGTSIGYQSTTNEDGTIAFGHDKGDVSGYTVTWKQKATTANGKYYDANGNEIAKNKYDALKNSDSTYNDYTQAPTIKENTYTSAQYNRLVKVADGQRAHDTVVMKQLTPYTKSDASNIGANLKTYTVGDDGETITEVAASDDAKNTNENAWGAALGTGKVADPTKSDTNDPSANGSQQLVTGGTVYNALQQQANDLKVNAGWGINIADEKDENNNVTKKNVISLNRNLGTKLGTSEKVNLTAGNTGLVLGTVVTDGLLKDTFADSAGNKIQIDFQNLGATGDHAVTVGGDGLMATGKYSTALGGYVNMAKGAYSSVSGGHVNTASGDYASVSGGWNNEAKASYSSVAGGTWNTASGSGSFVAGGFKNEASGQDASIVGGTSNKATAERSAVFGGSDNIASKKNSSVFGGFKNEASKDMAVVSGGESNTANGLSASVFGGHENTASGDDSAVAGGHKNTASGQSSTAVGGSGNTAAGYDSAVTGGSGNIVNGNGDFAAGGLNNIVIGDEHPDEHPSENAAFGGMDSVVQGKYATGVAGGSTGAKANNALAAGYQSVVTTANGTSIGYQSTTNEDGTIAFGHDKGDVSGYNVTWQKRTDKDANGNIVKNADGTTNDYTQAPTITENTYTSAQYNRLVKVADGQKAHDTVVMEQLTPYTKSDASNIGANLKTYTVGDDGETITEAEAEAEQQKASEDAWGKAIGTGKVEANNSQLVTGDTVYNAIQDKAAWKLTTNGEVADKAATIKPGTTVDFSADKNTENHSNVTISHDGSNVTIGLDKDIVLGEASQGKGGSLNVYSDSSDANNQSNHVSITGSTISVNYPKVGTDGKTTTDTRGVILGVGEDSNGGADGYIAFNNADGSYTYLHSATDAPDDLKNRLEYVGNDGQKKYIANLDDVSTAVNSAKTHFYSVNSDDATAGNYNNDGAKGKNSLAAGVDASANGGEAVAVGSHATAGSNAMAIGSYAKAENNSTAIGTHASATSSQNLAIGYYANVTGRPDTIKNSVALGASSTVGEKDILPTDNGFGVLSIGAKDKERRIIHVRAGVNDTDAVNVSQLKSAQNNLTDKGLIFAANSGDAYTAKLGTTVKIQGTKKKDGHEYTADNLTTEIDKDGNITIKMDKNISAEKIAVNGKDGKNGQPGTAGSIGINGQDGQSGVGIDGKDGISIKGRDGKDGVTMKAVDGKDGTEGHIGLTGPKGTNGKDGTNAVDITVKNGYDDKDKGINGTNGVDGKDGITRIVYTDKTGEHQVATMEDGMKYAGDDAQNNATKVISKKLNNTLDIIGGADSTKLTDKNIGVNSTDKGQLKVQLAKDLTSITSISNQTTTKVDGKDVTTGAKITLGTDGTTTISGGDVNVSNNKITNVGSGIEKDASGNITDASKTNAANIGDVQTIAGNATTDLTNKGLKFAANSGAEYTAKLGTTVKIQGTAKKDGHEYTADNLTTAIDKDGNITIMMDKNISAEKLAVNGKDGKDGQPGTAGSIGIKGQDGQSGVGIDGKDGISIKGRDGKDGVTIKAVDGQNGTEGHIGLTGPAGTNGKDGTSIDITVKNGYNTEAKDGKDGINGEKGVDGTNLTRVVYTDGTGEHQIATMEDGLKFKGDDETVIAKKLNNQLDIIGGADSTNLTEGNIGVNSTDKGQLKVQLAKDLTSITSISNQTTTKVDGKDVTTGAKITLGTDGTTTISGGDVNVSNNKITNVGSGIEKDASGNITDASKTNAANIGDVQTIAGNATTDLTNKGLKFAANSGAEYTAKLGTTVKIQGTAKKDGHEYTADNLTTAIDKDGNITIMMDKNISAEKLAVNGKDGKNGQPGTAGSIGISGQDGQAGVGIDGKDGISIKGKDGKDGVTMKAVDGKDGTEGHIGLTGPKGTNGKDGTNAVDITVKNGYDDKDKGINGTNGVDGKDGITRIVYTDKTGEHQVATMEDGMKFKGDDAAVIAKKLNNTLDIIGGADSKNLTEKNIGVNSDKDGKLNVQLAKDLKGITSISNQTTTKDGDKDVTTGAKIDLGSDGSVDVNGGKITNVGSGIEKDGKGNITDASKTNAANIGDVQNMVNDAKKDLTDGANGLNSKANIDASNIGANLKGADGKAASAEDKKANAEKWGDAIGTGKIEKDNGQLVTGKTVYEYNKPIAEDGKKLNYVSEDKTTGQNLGALDSQVKTNADNIAKNTESIQNITKNMQNLSDNAVQYDKDSNKSKVTLGGKDGTTITNVKDGTLNEKSTEAVNGKQLYNEQQAREAADKAISDRVTNNTNEITKIKNGDFTDASKTAIHNIAKDAVEVVDGVNTTVTKTEGTDTTPTKYAVNVEGKGKVASGDTGLISGDTLYKEVHVDKDGSYIKSGNTVGQNLSSLDTGLKTTSDLIHTNDKGDTIQIGGDSTATKIDVNGKDGKGRVITGVVTDANDPSSAANVGYVNGLTAANTQQIYRDMNNAYSRLDTNINRAAAGSNALAALHPLDFDPADKASFAVGYGHYHNANAAAVGAFYQPNANTMVNMGISLGNGDPGFNAGVSFKIGKGSAYNGVSKAEMAQTIHDQAAEISTIKANDAAKDKRIDALEKENQEMKKQIQEILARLNG